MIYQHHMWTHTIFACYNIHIRYVPELVVYASQNIKKFPPETLLAAALLAEGIIDAQI